jgi:hypothetical protein
MEWQYTRENLLRNADVQHMIAERAYLISQSRGFVSGHEIEDWFRAEHEIIDYLQRRYDAQAAEPPAADALALTDSAIYEEPVATPIASDTISAEPVNAPTEAKKKAPAKKSTSTKAAAKSTTPKAKSASTKSKKSKVAKTTAPRPKPTLRKASKKSPTAISSAEIGE